MQRFINLGGLPAPQIASVFVVTLLEIPQLSILLEIIENQYGNVLTLFEANKVFQKIKLPDGRLTVLKWFGSCSIRIRC